MIDNTEAKSAAEIRKVVQDVLVDVINEFSESAEDLIKDDTEKEADKQDMPKSKDDKNNADDKKEDALEAKTAVVSGEQDIQSECCQEPAPTVSAVPKVEILNQTQNLGQAGTTPVVNNVPETQDIHQTLGSADAHTNTEIQNTRSISSAPAVSTYEMPATAIVTPDTTLPVADNVVTNEVSPISNSGEINTFGTSIVYSQNEDGTFNVTFDKNGITRVSIVPSLMTTDLLPELEDFLVEALASAPSDATSPVETEISDTEEAIPEVSEVPDDVSVDNADISGADEGMSDLPDISQTDDNEDNILPKATMASLRKKYANKVMEIFKLGLLAKNTIISESKDKFFAKDKAEYVKKGKIIASETAKKKSILKRLTKGYLRARKERDDIKKLVSVLASSIRKSQKGLSNGLLTDSNAAKISSVLSSIVSKVVNAYGKPEFSTILASSVEHTKKVNGLVAHEISKNRKALISSKTSVAANVRKISKNKEINNDDTMSVKNVLNKNGIFRKKSNIRTPSVIVESNYVGRSSDTIRTMTRHDGTDEMIGEIANLI